MTINYDLVEMYYMNILRVSENKRSPACNFHG